MNTSLDITNTAQVRFIRMLNAMFLAGTRGRHGELMDGCLYNAFFARVGPLDGWHGWASTVPELSQFFDMADFFAAGNP